MQTRTTAPPVASRTGIETDAVRLDGVCKTFAPQRRGAEPVAALDGVSLRAARGEIVAVVGPSGCGKTTLLELVCGLIEPDRGTVAARPPRSWPSATCCCRGRAPSTTPRCALRVAGVERARARERAAVLLEDFGLGAFAQARPHELSGGMRQRVAFARTLLAGRAGAVPRRAVRRARRAHAPADAGVAGRGAARGPAHGRARHARRRGGDRARRPRRRAVASAPAASSRRSTSTSRARAGARTPSSSRCARRRSRSCAHEGAARAGGARRRLGGLRRSRRHRRAAAAGAERDRRRARRRPRAAVEQLHGHRARDRPRDRRSARARARRRGR